MIANGLSLSRDKIYRWLYYIVGFDVTRKYIRSLTDKQLNELISYGQYVWYTANDNDVPCVKRPSWLKEERSRLRP